MREMIRYGLTLGLICVVAGASLAAVNSVAQPKITAQAESQEQASLKDVLPEGVNFDPVQTGNDILYYKAYDKNGQWIGVAFKAQGKGYSSPIETMVGMTRGGEILTIKILSQNETPGLGAKVTEPDFTGQFSHKAIQDLSGVEGITGATLSSRTVIDSVAQKAQEVLGLLKNE
jgi:electron transport complex protein RnfG